MAGSAIGREFVVSIFGESHGRCVAVLVDGYPAGLEVKLDEIQAEVDRRIPSDVSVTSPRREADRVEILSGVHEERTTGSPVSLLVWNKDVRSQDYEKLREVVRPGHADYPTRLKYGGFSDFRGGGRASGRMTAALTMAGALAKILLKGVKVEVLSHAVQIHNIRVARDLPLDEIREATYTNPLRCADLSVVEAMKEAILKAKADGDSVGGIVEAVAVGVPPGIGEPFFDNLDADIAKALFSIPAVKGVEFGVGFRASSLKGSENNDPFVIQNGRVVTLTNNAGGILGGLSNGMPIVARVAFKPTSSILKEQKTVNLQSMRETTLEVEGRHDPCIIPKAVPVVAATMAIVIADHMIRAGAIPRVFDMKSQELRS